MKVLFEKYKEIIMYLIFGVLTTLVNYLTYTFFAKYLHLELMLANTLAFLLAVIFAYISNRTFVFCSKVNDYKGILKEAIEFFFARLFSFFLDMVLMYLLVKVFKFDDLMMKALVNVLVIVINYGISKFYIFKH